MTVKAVVNIISAVVFTALGYVISLFLMPYVRPDAFGKGWLYFICASAMVVPWAFVSQRIIRNMENNTRSRAVYKSSPSMSNSRPTEAYFTNKGNSGQLTYTYEDMFTVAIAIVNKFPSQKKEEIAMQLIMGFLDYCAKNNITRIDILKEVSTMAKNEQIHELYDKISQSLTREQYVPIINKLIAKYEIELQL